MRRAPLPSPSESELLLSELLDASMIDRGFLSISADYQLRAVIVQGLGTTSDDKEDANSTNSTVFGANFCCLQKASLDIDQLCVKEIV